MLTRPLIRNLSTVAALACAAGLVAVPMVGRALSPVAPGTAMAEAARAFLGALSPEQKKRAAWAWDDASRTEWFFIPKDRAGLPLHLMDAKQKDLAMALFRSGVSPAGFEKGSQIIALESVLREIEKDPVKRDPEKYHVWIFGTPDPKGTWGWKFEGHHMSLNFTIVKGSLIATTPAFLGTNPAEVREGPLKGRRVLKAEEDLGRELLMSFDDKTRAQVVYDAKAPADVLTAAASKVDPLPKAGLPVKQFSKAQKDLVRKLLREYADLMPAKLAAERMARVEKAGLDNITFAWAGGAKRGEPHYYRLQGPTFLVEYDNTQNNANHAHSVWRDFNGDFGRDLLAAHLKKAH